MRARPTLLLLFLAATAAAQPRSIFDADDFVDPRERDGHPLFVSRLLLGVAKSYVDRYRPLHHDAGFVHIANSFYFSDFQFDYKRSEVRGEHGVPVMVCECEEGPIYFPTPPAPDATPAAPPPGSTDTLQFAWYRTVGVEGAPPLMLRYRLSWSRQPIDTAVTEIATGEKFARLSGREQSFGLEADTHLRIRGRDIFGSLQFARTKRSGTVDDRSQNELTYTNRFPAWRFRRILLRPTLTVGGVSGRGGTALNVVHPQFEAFWHDTTTRANLHLIWAPQTIRSGRGGWTTTHQIAFFVDRALFVRLFTNEPRNDSARQDAGGGAF
ncbi:MAG TPA: hypothetical protein VGQ36_01250 [Thermoanaerobaculia bacterium]|jgi:hypothetical protein|nr:hypothetical protein [Thermoanaerobaculia bacterium]